MQDFSTKQIRHEFKIDGRLYWLPGVTVTDFEEVGRLGGLEPELQIPAFRGLILRRVRGGGFYGWLTGRSAARRLNIAQLTALFGDWAGMKSGEALASPLQPSSTVEN